jgi:tetratricopeptide (TPR) repeat protein
LDREKFLSEREQAAWEGWCRGQEKRIELALASTDKPYADELRKEYDGQIKAWQAHQGLKGLVPQNISQEPDQKVSPEQVSQIKELLDIASALVPAALTAEMLLLRGSAFHQAGLFNDALAAYDKAIALSPRHAGAHTSRGVAWAALDRFEDAVDAHDQAITLEPEFALPHENKGIALQRLGRWPES